MMSYQYSNLCSSESLISSCVRVINATWGKALFKESHLEDKILYHKIRKGEKQ